MNTKKSKPKFTIITVIIKILCWLLFFAGIPIIIIGISNIVLTSLEFNSFANIFDDPELALYSNKSVLLNNISTISIKFNEIKDDLQLIVIGILVIFLARIISKPLIIGSTLFIFAFTNKETRSRARLSFVLNLIFLSISCIAVILALKGFSDIARNFEGVIIKEKEFLDVNSTLIKTFTEENYSINIQNMSSTLQNHFPDFVNSIPTIIWNQTTSFITIGVAIGIWIITELIHFTTWNIMKNN
ncbi:MAG: hypothetical protein KFW07_03890 [Mycoplasmataceae bacterium]|nr:hypothetical protein [Mycoplasmataceae bacterium]